MDNPEGIGCPLLYGHSFDFAREVRGDFQREKISEIFLWAPKKIVVVVVVLLPVIVVVVVVDIFKINKKRGSRETHKGHSLIAFLSKRKING